MSKTEIFIGSPRKNGNTSYLSKYLNDLLNANDVLSSLSYLYDYEIEPCVDCRSCKRDDMCCVLNYDANLLYEKMENADVIVFGTPIYWFGPTAKMKLLIDRLRPYFTNKKLAGKNGAVILSAGSGAGDCDLAVEMFKRIFRALEINFVGNVLSQSYDAGDASADKEAIYNIEQLSQRIIKTETD